MGAKAEAEAAEALAHLRRLAALAGIDPDDATLPESHHVILGGRRFHYLAWGEQSAPPILFLHGGNQSAHTWDVVCLALSRRYHCIALDQRGHGDSEWSYEFDYGPEAHAGDVERLAELLGWSRFVLVGMSMGCLNGLQYAGTRGGKLAGFVAVDAGPYIEGAAGRTIVDFVEANRVHATLDDFVAAAARFNTRRRPELLRHSLTHSVRRMADGTYAWRADRRRDFDLGQMERWLESAGNLVPRITCPTLIVRGAESNVLTQDGMMRFAHELPDARTVTIPDAGHTVQGDNPKALVAAIESFLRSIGY